MTGPDADKNLSGEEPYGAKFNAKDMQKVMTWAFESDDAFKTVAVAHGQYATKMLDELADKIALEVKTEFEAWRKSHPEATEQQLNAMRQEILEERMTRSEGAEFSTATRSLSMTTWVITDAANIADIEEAKENDARFAMFKEVAEKVVGLAPGPQGKFVGLWWTLRRGRSSEKSSPTMKGRRGHVRTRTPQRESPGTCSPTSQRRR